MALPALLGAGARAVGGSMIKSGGRAAASKILGRGRKRQTQPGRIIPGRGGVDGGKGGAIIKPKVKMVSAREIKSLQTGDTVSPGKDPLKSIYGNLILIEKILKGNNIADRDALKEQKKNDKQSDREGQEKRLETKPPKIDKKKGEIMKLPETGIFGFLKNFIGNILMGYFAVRLIKYLPQMLDLLKGLGRVVEFITDVGIFLVDGIASFINFAYNVYDGTRNIFKSVGLEGAFDGIMKAVEVAITVLTFALGAKSLGGFGGGKGGTAKTPKTRVRSKPQKAFQAGRPKRMQPPGTTSQGAASRYARRYGEGAAKRRFGQAAGKKAAQQAAGKLGVKGAARVLGPLVKRIPVIGGLIEFVLSVVSGDSVGKAAFRAVGSGLGTWIGGALGSLIPVPFVGTAIGAFVGGAGGAELAGAMYDAFFGGKEKQPEPEEPEAKQSGGEVGRGFQEETVTQQKKAIRKKPSFTKIKPPLGGKIKTGEKSESAWWDFLNWGGGQDMMIDLGPGGQMLANKVVNLGNSFGEYPYFGPILSLAAKVILGEKPNEEEYKNVGYGLNMLVGDGVQKGKIGEGIKGYEDGGMIDDYYAMAGVDVGRWASDTFKKELSTTLNKNFDVMKYSSGSTAGPGTAAGERDTATGELVPGTQTGTAPGATYSRFGTAEQKKMLDAIAFAEGTTGSYGTLYGGRVIDELAAGEMTIAEVLKMQKSKMYKGESVYGSGYDSNATGRYQFMSYVLEEEIGKQGVDPSEKFTPEMQDRLILNRVSSRLGVTPELLAAEGMSDKVIDKLAFEFASFPNLIGPDAQGRVGTNTSYYGQGGKSAAEIKQAYGDSTGESSAIEIADSQVQPPSLPDEPGSADTSSGGDISVSGSNIANIGKDLASKGFAVAEHPDFTKDTSGGRYTPGKGYVSNVHRGDGHYQGRAIDVTQHKGGDPEYKQTYLSVLNSLANNPAIKMLIHDTWGFYKDGKKSGPGAHGHPTHMHIETKRSHAGTKLSNREQMLKILPGQSLLDENSSKALGATNLARFNAASTPEEMKNIAGQIAGVSDYAPYEQGAQQTVMVQDPPMQMPEDSPKSSGGDMMGISGAPRHDPFEFLDFQG